MFVRSYSFHVSNQNMEVPNPNNFPLEEHVVNVTINFSGTEIQTKAKYSVTGKEVKTVCDFLSTIKVELDNTYIRSICTRN